MRFDPTRSGRQGEPILQTYREGNSRGRAGDGGAVWSRRRARWCMSGLLSLGVHTAEVVVLRGLVGKPVSWALQLCEHAGVAAANRRDGTAQACACGSGTTTAGMR
jgi:hypothetical protein